jgi:hypothetical protein
VHRHLLYVGSMTRRSRKRMRPRYSNQVMTLLRDGVFHESEGSEMSILWFLDFVVTALRAISFSHPAASISRISWSGNTREPSYVYAASVLRG